MSTLWIFKNVGRICLPENVDATTFVELFFSACAFYLQLLKIERRHRKFLVVLRFFVKIGRITYQFTKDILCMYTINCTFEYIYICIHIHKQENQL